MPWYDMFYQADSPAGLSHFTLHDSNWGAACVAAFLSIQKILFCYLSQALVKLQVISKFILLGNIAEHPSFYSYRCTKIYLGCVPK